MKLVIFGIDYDKNLIVQFLVFIQPYTQQPLILYQIKTVPVPIIDKNTQVQSYKHKCKYSCKWAIWFDLGSEIIRDNCKFDFYYNKTDITPTVLDGGNEIILANWPNDMHIICIINNNIPVRIPGHLYVLVNRSVLCTCGIEAENHFLLESLAACHDSNSKLVMYFTMNATSVNYLEKFTNMRESLRIKVIRNKTTFEIT